ncbi:MAG: serine/threonine-protein phosphatase, partial [Phycisphaerae bacterium]|nr:serine/threonine-protein phosphatase [Phycisphaerae bacterium]
MTTVAFTSDFHEAFEQQTSRLLRGRFLLFTGLFAGLSLVWLIFLTVFFVVAPMTADAASPPAGISTTTTVAMVQRALDVLCYGVVFAYAWRRSLPDTTLLRLSMFIIAADGLYSLILATSATGWSWAHCWSLMLPHVIASACLPWTFAQAVRPMLPVLGLNAVLAVGAALMAGASEAKWGLRMSAVGLTALVPVPGIVIAGLKHDSRVRDFKVQFLESRYGQFRRELTDARKIHESLFPRAEARGSVRFDYRYQPMRLIGGDYLYARFHEGEARTHAPAGDAPLTLLLIDVTGHGVAAALTVNRLYGEVERLFGENPDLRPGEVIRALNRYVYHTLANHALYVTGVCVRVDPRADRLEFASAGHPPGFLRGVDGTLDELPSTTFLLGAVRDDEFDPAPQTRPFVRGDTLILYTDGAMEAANAQGHQFGLKGLQRTIASVAGIGPGDWPAMLLTAVDRHRAGPPSDDTLVVEVSRLIVTAEGAGTRQANHQPAGAARV